VGITLTIHCFNLKYIFSLTTRKLVALLVVKVYLTWIAVTVSGATELWHPDQFLGANSTCQWGLNLKLSIAGLALSMAVNTLVTGFKLIVFKILNVMVYLEVGLRAVSTSIGRTLGLIRGTKFRHVVFLIIESGIALSAIQRDYFAW
jgi:hypothetical protein